MCENNTKCYTNPFLSNSPIFFPHLNVSSDNRSVTLSSLSK
uniref:Uncharacterized protein n=1 Tax=Anguilla anguilla TaxID=7936 RepID=A0A0E9SQL8_ANGAN